MLRNVLCEMWQINTGRTLVKHLNHQSSILTYAGFFFKLVVYFTTGYVKGVQRSANPHLIALAPLHEDHLLIKLLQAHLGNRFL